MKAPNALPSSGLSRVPYYCLLTFVILTLIGCGVKNNVLSTGEMTTILKERNDKFGNYFISGNGDSVASMYTENARLCLNGIDFVTGRKAIAAFWTDDMKTSKTLAMVTETLTAGGVREVIYETGRAHLKMTYLDSAFNLTVKYCNVWRLQPDGKYLLDVDFPNKDKAN